MMRFEKAIMWSIVGGLAIVTFQNCSVPLDSLAEKYDPNYQGADSTETENASETPSEGDDLNLSKTGPVVYLYEPGSLAMVKDVCLSDNSYLLKVRNSGSNPKLCLTKQSDPNACVNNVSSFVKIAEAGYQLVGQDWVKDGMGHSLRQLILPSQAPMSLSLFYVDDSNPIPRQVGGFNVHACADKIVYNHVSFSCPSQDICANFFPETSMEAGSCVPTTGGVRVTCAPRFVESGSPRSGSFAKFQEPALAGSAGGNIAEPDSGSGVSGGSSGGSSGSSGGSADPVQCGSTPKSTSIFEWPQYNAPGSILETKTIKQGTSRAFRFIANKGLYPDGQQLQFETTVYVGGSNRMDFTISPCPGLFASEQKKCSYTRVKINSINLGFDPSDNTKCILEDGKEYYLNIEPTDGYSEVAKIVGSQRL